MTSDPQQITAYLSFKLGTETYAIHVGQTLKILPLSDITKVPNAQDQMKGVINHHGNIIPVIDMKQAFGLGVIEKSKNTCIIILSVINQREQMQLGVIVDEVLSVETIEETQISKSPALGSDYSFDHLLGVFKKEESFIMILNIPAFMSQIIGKD